MAFQFFSGQELTFLINIVFALAIGFIVGIERERKGKPAGIGTHAFVIAGAMLLTMLSQAMAPNDAARIAANIVTGIGFLGAGMIIRAEGDKIANLTTAANVWFSAAIGMAIGFGWYAISIMGAVFILLIPQIQYTFGNGKKH